jgi:DNA topoisomerase-6 subunit B
MLQPGESGGVAPQPRKRHSAEALGAQARDISISEFFSKNRHLLGFDNASRALMTSVKEAVDNSLDACEEAGILPEVVVRLEETGDRRFRMTVSDNGPGIIKANIPKVFGKLLYGSKFHRRKQSRGQQGIGISAAGMYGQLTTGKPVQVMSKTGKGRPAHTYELIIDTAANKPKILSEGTADWLEQDHGTRVTIDLEATYKGGKRSVDEFIQCVAFANPHVRIEYWRPGKAPLVYPRVSAALPPETEEIQPHPYGIELGVLINMMAASKLRTVGAFLKGEFSRVTPTVVAEICERAKIPDKTALGRIDRTRAEVLYKAIAETKIRNPPTDCLAPIGEGPMLASLKALLIQQQLADGADDDSVTAAEAKVQAALEEATELTPLADAAAHEVDKAGVVALLGKSTFVTAVTRKPKVYRGNPFQVEAALAYGGDLPGDGLAQVYRFANRVPLLYQQGACAMTQSILRTNWRGYNVQQAKGALPTGPLVILVHMASVWVPFTSEAKEAVAPYDDVIVELKAAVQECGRRLARHLSRQRRVADADTKRKYIERYIPHIGESLQQILALSAGDRSRTEASLTDMLERQRKL